MRTHVEHHRGWREGGKEIQDFKYKAVTFFSRRHRLAPYQPINLRATVTFICLFYLHFPLPRLILFQIEYTDPNISGIISPYRPHVPRLPSRDLLVSCRTHLTCISRRPSLAPWKCYSAKQSLLESDARRCLTISSIVAEMTTGKCLFPTATRHRQKVRQRESEWGRGGGGGWEAVGGRR